MERNQHGLKSHTVGTCDDPLSISNILGASFAETFNAHSSDVCAGIKIPITDSDVCDVRISVECVYDAFSHLKQRKVDSSGLDSSHLTLALPVIAQSS